MTEFQGEESEPGKALGISDKALRHEAQFGTPPPGKWHHLMSSDGENGVTSGGEKLKSRCHGP